MTWILVGLGGALGALLRALAGRIIVSNFPWATLLVNLVGSFLLAAFLCGGLSPAGKALWATGFCGALTTYSTFVLETLLLWRSGRRWAAGLNVLSTLLLCCLASLLGLVLFA